jgi:hypothetical protein
MAASTPTDRVFRLAVSGALAAITVFVIFASMGLRSEALAVVTSAFIPNVTPIVPSIYVSTTNTLADDTGGNGGVLGLTPGGFRNYYVTGTIQDKNGREDITAVRLVFYRSDLTPACVSDLNNCYRVLSCSVVDSINPLEKEFSCPLSLAFFTDSTTTGGVVPSRHYIVRVSAIDDNGAIGANATLTKEVETLLALNVPLVLDYGQVAYGQSTTADTNQHMVIEQYGNDQADLELSGSEMTCSGGGVIPFTNQQWALTDIGFGEGLVANAISPLPVDTDFGMPYRINDSEALTKTLFWNITVPATGASGECIGNNTLTTIAS